MNTTSTLNRREVWCAIALFILCALLRFHLLKSQGLWADETFSLAMATGHSLEHAAAEADPAMGDYVEHREPVHAADYRRYLEHESPVEPPSRVVRAVFKSDTSPPGYYLLLYLWTRILGTGDSALRSLSLLCALMCMPLLWLVGRHIGGTRTALAACVLFTFSPTSIYYSTEGRMYSLLWLLTLATMLATLRIQRRGSSVPMRALWTLCAAAGLLTHYFFAFVLAGMCGWLMLYPGRSSRAKVIASAVVVGLLVAPWYVQVPATLKHWRVTDYWLTLLPYQFNRTVSILWLPWSYFTLRGHWAAASVYDKINGIVLGLVGLLAIIALKKRLFTPRRLMLWICILCACGGLVVFDAWRKTYAVDCPRYAAAGYPAALLLLAFAIASIPRFARWSALVVISVICLLGVRPIYSDPVRINPTRQIGWYLDQYADADDVVIVSSIPSGVAAIARAMQSAPGHEPLFVSWVGQLKQRKVPDDLLRLAQGHKRIILIRMHEVWAEPDHQDWLWRHNKFSDRIKLQDAEIDFFEPTGGGKF